jgi:hypothetical protein
MEASPGIEPGCADLQSAASPLRHEAITVSLPDGMRDHKRAHRRMHRRAVAR